MATLEEALADEHFVKRGLFSEQITSSAGDKTMPALPVPIVPEFRVKGARTYTQIKK
jgi:hypothetical protein